MMLSGMLLKTPKLWRNCAKERSKKPSFSDFSLVGVNYFSSLELALESNIPLDRRIGGHFFA